MKLTLRNYLFAGLISAAIAVVFANAWHALFSTMSGRSFEQLTFGSITIAAILLPLLAAAFYYLMARFTDNAAAIFITTGVTLLFFTLVFTIFAPRPGGFATASLPLQVIVALSSLIIMPLMVRPNESAKEDLSQVKTPPPPRPPFDSEIPHQAPSRAHYPPETGIPD